MNELEKLKKLAEEFNLKYKDKWFQQIWVSKEENIFLEYLWMCPDPIYKKYGKNPLDRAKNIEAFLASDDFLECINRWGGQVIESNSFKKYFLIWINYIENNEIKTKYIKFYNRIIKELKLKNSSVAILTKSKKEHEKRKLKSIILFHEWIHILLESNKLRIKNNWKYNEGLVTFFQEYAGKKLWQLESKAKKSTYDFQKQYFIYAIKFRNWLKGINLPAKRKQKLLTLVKKYSK